MDLDKPVIGDVSGKQAFMSIGTSSSDNSSFLFNETYVDQCVDYIKQAGVNISAEIIDDFGYTFPSNLPTN